ncbi:hypothetical protein KKE06_04065, partial [Candidatus Micrarchaeota archaeon]|nr:hypothetical protein [Candidatus Micrarchaeota archaeon]MBU1930773.1 hypothetical protein [Candidatus Micrarchaeota archaeon]
LKGISSKDTATLANDHFGTTTIVDAPASNWANMNDPDEDDAFGNMMPLMAAGLLPAMIPPLIDALGNARDNGQKAGKKAMDEFNDGKEAAENAEKKAKDLADECKPGKGACENMKALQDALKKLKPKMEELTKQSMTQSISSLGSACGFSGGNLEFTAIKGLITNGIEIGGEACGSMTSAMGELKSEFNTALNNFGSLSDSVCSGGTGSTAPAVMQKTRYAFLQASPLPSYLNLFNNLPATVRGPNADNGTNTLPIPVTIIPGTTPITPPPGTIPPGSIDPTAWIQAHDPKGNGTFTDTGSEWRLEIVQGNQMLRLVSWDYGQTTSIVPVWQYQDEWVSASELDAILNAGNHLVLQDNVSRAYSNGILAVPVEDTWAVGELPLGTAPHHTRESVYDAIASSDGKIIIRHSYFDWWDLLHWFPQTEWFSPETNWASGTPFVRSTDYIVSLHNFGQLVQGNFQEILNSTEKNYWLANQTNAPAFFQSQTSALSSFNAACKEFNTAHEKTQKAVSDYSQAKKLGRFTSAGDVSKAGKKAGDAVKTNVISDLGQTTSAITSGNGSITEATGKMNELKTNFDSIAKKRDCLKQTTDEIGKYVKSQKARTTSPLTSQEKACIAAFKSFEGSFNETLDPVDDLIKTGADSVDQTREKVLENLETTIPNLSENANTAATDATQQSNEAANEMNDLSDATKNVSKDNTGTNSAALGNMLAQATQLGLMAAMMDGMFNADDTDDFKPGEEPRVQNQTQVFNIDLRKDNQGIELDKEGIIGYYDPENHKVFGDMEKQTIGVVFENVGIEESEPYYSTATFKAVEHLYGPVTTIPFSTPFNLFGSGWGLEFFGQTSNYSQQFHLKYVTGDLIEPLPPIDSATFSCTQGAMVGRTGEGALPRVKLSWKWNDIPLNLCDASNENYVYCDSTQFAIVVLKRLRALDDFLKANGGLPCPTNPFEVLLTEDTAPLSEYLGESPFDARSLVEGCWLPESTELFDGYPSLLYYVSEAGDSVQWTEEIKNIQDLQDLLLFDAYIMQDGFSEDFLQDFSQYYNHISFSDAPAYFHQDPQGSYNQFFDNGLIEFKQKFVNSNQLPTSGLYQADLLVEFGDGWKLFDSSGDPAGTVTVELLAVRQTPFNSPFYYLPFNGLVGLEGSRLNRQGYGVGFDVLEQDAFRISRQSDIDTLASTSSNPVHFVSVSQERALENLNSRASQRGFILDITNVTTNQKNMLFTPALATPVLMKVNRVQTSEEFSAYYMLRESDIPATTGNTLTFWTGSGACRDFSGDIIASVFDEKPDRKTNEGDLVNGWEFAYAIDWEKAVKGGDVYLRTVFYTPAEKSYSLFSLSDNATLRTADQGEGESIELRGISDMAFNRKGTTDTDRITALDDLFTLVEQGAVCVTNTGVRTSFWWNPKTILEKEGSTDQSIAAIEQGLEAGSSCIG